MTVSLPTSGFNKSATLDEMEALVNARVPLSVRQNIAEHPLSDVLMKNLGNARLGGKSASEVVKVALEKAEYGMRTGHINWESPGEIAFLFYQTQYSLEDGRIDLMRTGVAAALAEKGKKPSATLASRAIGKLADIEELEKNLGDTKTSTESTAFDADGNLLGPSLISGKHGQKRTRDDDSIESDAKRFRKHRAKQHTSEASVRLFEDVKTGTYLDNSVNLIFYSTGGNNCYLDNPNFKANWDAISNKATYSLDKLVAYALMTTPFNREVLQNFAHHNIIMPCGYLLLRPHQRYLTALGIKTKAGPDTGSVFYNPEQTNLMEEDRTTTKTRLTHYSWEARAVVTNPALVHLAWDVFIMETRGGAGTIMYTYNDNDGSYNPLQHQYGRSGASIFSVIIGYRERKLADCIDISGHFGHLLVAGMRDIKSGNRSHYSTAVVYNSFWGWRTTDQIGTVSCKNDYHPLVAESGDIVPHNSTVWQGPYDCYDPRTKREVPRVGKGHFESYAYPGCKPLRQGGSKSWVAPRKYQEGVIAF